MKRETEDEKTQNEFTQDDEVPSAADWYNGMDQAGQQAYSQYYYAYYTQMQQQGYNAQWGGKTHKKEKREHKEEEEDEEDRSQCTLCNVKFEDNRSYIRHMRGMIHTQRLLAKDVQAGKVAADPPAFQTFVPEVPAHVQMIEGVDPNKRDLNPDDLNINGTPNKRYFCQVCNVTVSSEETLRSHLEGKKHKKTLKSKATMDPATYGSTKPIDTGRSTLKETGQEALLQRALDKCEDPMIGLEYVTEFVSEHTEPRYVCNLCSAKCDPRMLVSHVRGQKHRLTYLKDVRCEMYGEVFSQQHDKDLMQQMLKQKALEIEAKYGRQRVKQKREMLPIVPKREIYGGSIARMNSNLRTFGRRAPQPPDPEPFMEEEMSDCVLPNAVVRAQTMRKQAKIGVATAPNATKQQPQLQPQANAPNTATSPIPRHINLRALLPTVSKIVISNDEEADIAFQITNSLTQALLSYRLKRTNNNPHATGPPPTYNEPTMVSDGQRPAERVPMVSAAAPRAPVSRPRATGLLDAGTPIHRSGYGRPPAPDYGRNPATQYNTQIQKPPYTATRSYVTPNQYGAVADYPASNLNYERALAGANQRDSDLRHGAYQMETNQPSERGQTLPFVSHTEFPAQTSDGPYSSYSTEAAGGQPAPVYRGESWRRTVEDFRSPSDDMRPQKLGSGYM